MPATRCKFVCNSVNKRKGFNGHEFVYDATFVPVFNGSDENKAFFAATPAGNISVSSFVADTFQPGKEYFVDFTLAE